MVDQENRPKPLAFFKNLRGAVMAVFTQKEVTDASAIPSYQPATEEDWNNQITQRLNPLENIKDKDQGVKYQPVRPPHPTTKHG